MKPVRVVIVDDSALMRKLISEILSSSPRIEVVATAADAYQAREQIRELNPDVITLDIEMPKMDGLTFLEKIMRLKPTPVVMISSLAEEKASVTLEALEIGAVDFVTKPKIDLIKTMESYAEDIIEKVLSAAQAKGRLVARSAAQRAAVANPNAQKTSNLAPIRRQFKTTEQIIAIGASTGGTVAITDVLAHMPATSPGIVIAQHIPESFSQQFANRADGITRMKVRQAEDGEQILSGHVYIAPGDRHLKVVRDGARYICRLDSGPAVNRHIPSVDVLFDSVAQNVGANALGVILTGMGKDGAKGLLNMKQAGATTIVQDEQSSVVWGMPKAAYEIGAADMVEPLDRIHTRLLELMQKHAA